ncbi:AP endonuclease [Clostridium celatum]|uniref:DUF6673 family protein n=1 Tax=Clostridium celatum TaxID=36834 RepID=UPI001F2808D2|nr:DUF6673 family protein [Clostridium celatum]MCE9656504.1 AP endonuclease [Clostridium celatum]
MIINGVELEDLDIYDVEVVEKYEKVIENINKPKKFDGLKDSVVIRKLCEEIFNVFNELFGEGSDKKVFGNKVNLLICIKAFEELILQVNEQKKELDKIANKYSPNRAARRSKK